MWCLVQVPERSARLLSGMACGLAGGLHLESHDHRDGKMSKTYSSLSCRPWVRDGSKGTVGSSSPTPFSTCSVFSSQLLGGKQTGHREYNLRHSIQLGKVQAGCSEMIAVLLPTACLLSSILVIKKGTVTYLIIMISVYLMGTWHAVVISHMALWFDANCDCGFLQPAE